MKTPINIEIPKVLPQHPWHPSVVYVPTGWSGHRYWMAQTPYPPFDVKPYKDRWELPCIHYSDDGIHWESIDVNPIDDLTEQQIVSHSYHSDPHLVMRDGVLYCYYRLMEDHDTKTTILRKCSKDGIHWSEREIIEIVGEDGIHKIPEVISPAIIWTGEKWLLYFVDDTFTNLQRGIQVAESEDGRHFVPKGSVWEQQQVKPWHIDVQIIDDKYYLLVHDVDNNSLWLYTSKNGLKYEKEQKILSASHKLSDFWSHKLYRACLGEVEGKKNIYFSANDGMASYIGLTRQNRQGEFEIIDCLSGDEKAAFIIRFWWRRGVQFIQRVIHFIEKRI